MVNKAMRLKAREATELFKLLSDESRYLILSVLAKKKGGLYVREIAEALKMSHSAVSHQLGALVESGIVTYEKEGRLVRYSFARTASANALARAVKAVQ